jgi:uncharacterized protein with HEPN domain
VEKDYEACLCDILEAAQRTVRFPQAMTLEQFRDHERFCAVLERQIEIMGEAADSIKPRLRERSLSKAVY